MSRIQGWVLFLSLVVGVVANSILDNVLIAFICLLGIMCIWDEVLEE